jgi:hypothetical protein
MFSITNLVYKPIVEAKDIEVSRLINACISDMNQLLSVYDDASDNIDSYASFSDLIVGIQLKLKDINDKVNIKG